MFLQDTAHVVPMEDLLWLWKKVQAYHKLKLYTDRKKCEMGAYHFSSFPENVAYQFSPERLFKPSLEITGVKGPQRNLKFQSYVKSN